MSSVKLSLTMNVVCFILDELQTILPGWTFDEDIAEEKPYNYENYQICEEQNHAPISVSRDPPREQTGRIRGRSNRNVPAQKYEVTVELHAPPSSALTQETSFVTSESKGNFTSSEPLGPDGRLKFVHRYQGSGSGRSESSKADSGYEGENDSGGFEANKYSRGNNSKPRKFYTSTNNSHVPYDNAAFTHDHDHDALPSSDHDALPSSERYSPGNFQAEIPTNHRTDRYNDRYSNDMPMSGDYDVRAHARDYDVSAHGRQFQTIEQLNARMDVTREYSNSHATVI